MKDFFKQKRQIFLQAFFIGALVTLPGLLTRAVQAQSPTPNPNQRTETYESQCELTLDCILAKLSSTRLTDQKKKNQLILAYIKKSKDNLLFVMTEDEEKQLRNAGADDGFIAYIAKVSSDMEKTSFGNVLLGDKYLKIAKDNLVKEKEKRQSAMESRYVKKNEDEAKQIEAEAEQFKTIAQENANKAIPYYNQAKLLEADNSVQYTAVAYSNLAVAYSILGDFDKSLSYATQAIEIEPNAVRYFNRASLYDAKARTMQSPQEKADKRAAHELAIKDCESAISLDSTMGVCRQLITGIKKLWGMP